MAPTDANAAGMNDTTALRVSSLSTSRSERNLWATECRLASGLWTTGRGSQWRLAGQRPVLLQRMHRQHVWRAHGAAGANAPGVEPVQHGVVDGGGEALGAHAEAVAHRGAGEDQVQVAGHLRAGWRVGRRAQCVRGGRFAGNLLTAQQAGCARLLQINQPLRQLTRWMKKRQTFSLVSTRPAALVAARHAVMISSFSSAANRSAFQRRAQAVLKRRTQPELLLVAHTQRALTITSLLRPGLP